VLAGGVELWAPLAYEGAARALVAGLKFRGALAIAETMAAQIAANVPPAILRDGELVPVPLHPARLRRRGFNQAARLAEALSRRTGLPVADCLERAGSPSTQVGRDRRARMRAIEGAVAVRRKTAAPRAALLVDDVVTTGATLAACTAALAPGPGRTVVRALAYARTPGR
jgi:ComF family protein